MLLNTPLYGLICVYNWILVEPLKLLNAQNELPAHISAQEESERKYFFFLIDTVMLHNHDLLGNWTCDKSARR